MGTPMNIDELLSEIKFKPRISNKSTSGVIQSPRLQFIAAGCQAIAYYHKAHPNTVVKVAAVSVLCQDETVWNAMEMSGSPCPIGGAVGDAARQAWYKIHPDWYEKLYGTSFTLPLPTTNKE